jgi:hypothetical protein
MATQFVRELKQFALAVDIVNTEVLSEIGHLLGKYFRESLKADMYEVRVNAPAGTQGERFLRTIWSHDDQEYTTPLLRDDGKTPRGHTEYAVLHNKPLWIVSVGGGYLDRSQEYEDLWSKVTDLPAYRGWPNEKYSTSIIIPIGKPAIGFLNLEFCQRLDLCSSAKDELQQVSDIIEIFYRLHEAYLTQAHNTNNAIRNLNAWVSHSPLLKPTLFFAFSSRADEAVVGVVKQVLADYSEELTIVHWDEISTLGNINLKIRNIIVSAVYGICYFSEPATVTKEDCYLDNPNVLFEAGMFHALTSDSEGQTRWLPIREKNAPPIPFDFATDRMLVVPRQNNSYLNEQSFRNAFRKHLNSLLQR